MKKVISSDTLMRVVSRNIKKKLEKAVSIFSNKFTQLIVIIDEHEDYEDIYVYENLNTFMTSTILERCQKIAKEYEKKYTRVYYGMECYPYRYDAEKKEFYWTPCFRVTVSIDKEQVDLF